MPARSSLMTAFVAFVAGATGKARAEYRLDRKGRRTFKVELGADQLKTNMLVKNVGADESFDFQAALHSYFTVSSLENLEISGSFQGKEFLNKLVGDGGQMQTEERSAITISEEYDRVYKGVNDPVLKDAGTGKAVRVRLKSSYLLHQSLTF